MKATSYSSIVLNISPRQLTDYLNSYFMRRLRLDGIKYKYIHITNKSLLFLFLPSQYIQLAKQQLKNITCSKCKDFTPQPKNNKAPFFNRIIAIISKTLNHYFVSVKKIFSKIKLKDK